ncbi:hypothetical protein BDU57DRAFT_154144 [Ampelomyces quisqualis]|uniref:Uncharacterized protein n=1 Tax=Ampelomyces quisqualis TaxID=50730 RepID=A0A6A5QYU4_AMPQU|nr:hypothetical protein BDU57DRAFT_154144 [Ampelomyces quisqualis]
MHTSSAARNSQSRTWRRGARALQRRARETHSPWSMRRRARATLDNGRGASRTGEEWLQRGCVQAQQSSCGYSARVGVVAERCLYDAPEKAAVNKRSQSSQGSQSSQSSRLSGIPGPSLHRVCCCRDKTCQGGCAKLLLALAALSLHPTHSQKASVTAKPGQATSAAASACLPAGGQRAGRCHVVFRSLPCGVVLSRDKDAARVASNNHNRVTCQ